MITIGIEHFTFFPNTLADTFKVLAAQNSKIKKLSDLEIYNLISFDVLQELIKAAIDRPYEKFIFHYHFAPHAVFIAQEIRSMYVGNGFSSKTNSFVANEIQKQLDKVCEELDEIIPGYLEMTLEQKVNSVLSELDLIFNKFLKTLRNKNIRNIKFLRLSDIDKEIAAKTNRMITRNGAIDFPKNALQKIYSRDNPDSTICVYDLDNMNNYKMIENLDRVKCDVKFSVSDKDSKWNFGKAEGYVLCHGMISCIGKDGFKFFHTAEQLSEELVRLQNRQQFEITYKGIKLQWDSAITNAFMLSVLHNAEINEALNRKSPEISTEEWVNFCEIFNILPMEQNRGGSWNMNNGQVREKLLIKADVEGFIDEYQSLEKCCRDSKIFLGPTYLQFFLGEMLQLTEPQKNLVKC